MGWHPSRMFKRCSAMDLGTPVISAGFQANISKLSLSRLQSSILPFSDKLLPIVIVCSGYSGWIATLIPSMAVGSFGGRAFCVSATILHSAVIMEYLVNISKRRAFWSLNKDILKINDYGYQYAVSIKEDMAYQFLHSTKTTKETSSIRCIQRRPIRRIEDIVCEDSGRYRTWSLLQDTPNTLFNLASSVLHPTYHETTTDQGIRVDLRCIRVVRGNEIDISSLLPALRPCLIPSAMSADTRAPRRVPNNLLSLNSFKK
ncbi:hypothetical protein Tco_1332056 [Tanacetum coccineum]